MDICRVINILILLHFFWFITLSPSSLTNAELQLTNITCEKRTVQIYKTVSKPQSNCNNCKKYEICENNRCICPQEGASPCNWVSCKEKDCFPGSCTKIGGSTCKCHHGFFGDNCKFPVISKCNFTVTFNDGQQVKVKGKCNKKEATYTEETFAHITNRNFTAISADFFNDVPPEISGRSLTFINGAGLTIPILGTFVCETVSGRTSCSLSKTRNLKRNEIINTRLSSKTVTDGRENTGILLTFVIKHDQDPPQSKDKKDAIFFCETTTKEPNMKVYWSGWKDNKTAQLKYEWHFSKMESNGDTLVPKSQPVSQGIWNPGDPYPICKPDNHGVYMAVLKVSDEAENQKTVKTWSLYTNEIKVVKTEVPMVVQDGPRTYNRWITRLKGSNGEDDLTLNWTGHFKSSLPVEAFKRINSGPDDNVPALWDNGPPEEIKMYQYTWSKGDISKPQNWINATSGTVRVTAIREDGDIFTAWVTAFDHFQTNESDSMKFYVDSTEPKTGTDTTKITWNTKKRINGILHYSSSLMVDAQDKESGIHMVKVTVGSTPTKEGHATALTLPSEECKAHSDCTCSKVNGGHCQRHIVEAVLDNCIFKGLPSGSYQLAMEVYNEAMLSLNITPITIDFSQNNTDGLDEHPPPEKLTNTYKDKDTSRIEWKFIKACFTRMKLHAWYMLNGNRRDLNLTVNATFVEIDDLTKNDNLEFFIFIEYEGVNSTQMSLQFRHNKVTGGLGSGAIAGLVIFVLVLFAGVTGAILYIRRKRTNSVQRRPLPTPPANSHSSGRAPLPEPPSGGITNGMPKRPPPPIPNDTDDEIEIYGNADVQSSLRVLLPDSYTLGIQLGSGRLAIVLQATLKDSSKSQKVAAKMAKKKDCNRDKVIVRAKLNFMANEVTNHPNVVNLVAADLSVPIIFLELCEAGTLSDWVKENNEVTESIKKTMILFCLDVASGLKHLHATNITHRRMGIRNVMLTKSSKRLTARITGFGPLESELDSDKEDTRIPLRWMAPESLERTGKKARVHSHKSDMWAYGVTVWEIFSNAVMPFKGIKGQEVKNMVKRGERLPQPADCPQEIIDKIMQPCWQAKPEERPSADKVCNILTILTSGGKEPSGASAKGNIELEIYENANPSFQADDGLYENNEPIEQPMYLDMCP